MKVLLYTAFISFPFLIVDESVFYGILVALLGFLLVKFYTRVEEIGKDVKQLLINEARNSERIQQLEEEIKGIKDSLES